MFSAQKQAFFKQLEASGTALTFNDVRLRTAPSHVSPLETDISSLFSRNVGLKTPFASAAMDTVTEAKMAIELAKFGGIGVIHAGLEASEQREHVRRVKLHLNALIEYPVTVREDDSLEAVLAYCAEKGFDFRTFPVVDKANRLVGLLTQNDFDFAKDTTTQVGSVMTPRDELLTAKPDTTVKAAYRLMVKRKKKMLPLLDNNGVVVGLYIFSDVKRIIHDGLGSMYNVDKEGRLRVAAAVSTGESALTRVKMLQKYLDVVVIDTAQGDSKYAFETLRSLKKAFPKLDVVVGNISSPESAKLLAEAGADGIKIGQGPGSICTTRIETGIGTPQVTAVYNCKRAVLQSKQPDVPICADGGISEAGDVSIAIAAGADSVMMGGLLAGTKEAPGDVVQLEDGSRVKLYRGMGSLSAMRDSAAARQRYGGHKDSGLPLAEGIESYVPYRGSVLDTFDRFKKALRKSMSYVGVADIKTHQRKTLFYQITNAGLSESRPHDVSVIKAPFQQL